MIGFEGLLRHQPDAARVPAVAFLLHVRGKEVRRIVDAELFLHGRPRHRHETLRNAGIAADASHLFEHDNAPARLSRFNRGGKASRARTNDHDVGSRFGKTGEIFREAPESDFWRGEPGTGLSEGEEWQQRGPGKNFSAPHHFSSRRIRFTLLTA